MPTSDIKRPISSCSVVNVLVRACPEVAYIVLALCDNTPCALQHEHTHKELFHECDTDLIKLMVV